MHRARQQRSRSGGIRHYQDEPQSWSGGSNRQPSFHRPDGSGAYYAAVNPTTGCSDDRTGHNCNHRQDPAGETPVIAVAW